MLHGAKLYHEWGSSASRKVRFCLAEKGVDYEEHALDLTALEHHEPWFRRINPSAKVPVLVVGVNSLSESNLINEFLDELLTEPPLMPDSAFRRYEVRAFAHYIDTCCLPALQKHLWMRDFHPIARRWSDEEVRERLARVPSRERRELWYRMARDPFSSDEMREAFDELKRMLDEIEARAGKTRWLFGERFSLGDICAAPYVKRIEELGPVELSEEERPFAARWWGDVKARPAYAAAAFDD